MKVFDEEGSDMIFHVASGTLDARPLHSMIPKSSGAGHFEDKGLEQETDEYYTKSSRL